MRLALCFTFVLCSTAFAQNAPDNAATDSFRQRVLKLDLLNPPKRITLAQPVPAAPKLCSIPLLKVPNLATNDKMRTLLPRFNAESVSRAENVQVPAPPCN